MSRSFLFSPFAFAMISRRVIFALGTLLAGSALATPATAQSLFDILFGTQRRTVVYAPAPPSFQDERMMRRERVRRDGARAQAEARRRVERAAAHAKGGGVGGKMEALAPLPGVRTGSIAHFAADPTLRPGDVVVTTNGFMVYRGGHSEKSFARIGSGRPALATLEKASRGAAPQAFVARTPLAVSGEPQLIKAVATQARDEAEASVN